MVSEEKKLVATESSAAGDAEAIRYLKEAIASGKNWYLSLLGAIGLWSSAAEEYHDRSYVYLIDGEAFDWLLLAERLCETVEELLPEGEMGALLFHGVPPSVLDAGEIKELIGEQKYGQYLNYFYGVTVEEALVLAVQEAIDKEKWVQGLGKATPTDEAYYRIYDMEKDELLKQFRQEKHHAQLQSTTLDEMKEFTYWLFKYRLKRCEKARIASDTKKALDYLKKQWRQKGVSQALAADINKSFST
jgi:glycosyltransferase involved in cell wall biosynthesis